MEGLGQSPKKTVTKHVPLPSTVDGVVESVHTILSKGHVQSVSIALGKPITYERLEVEELLSPGEEQDLSDLSVLEVVRRIDMEEFSPEAQGLSTADPAAIFFWMLLYIEIKKLVPTCLLVGEASDFWRWLGIVRRAEKMDKFLGLRIERDLQVPEKCFMICAAESRWAPVSELKFALKGTVL